MGGFTPCHQLERKSERGPAQELEALSVAFLIGREKEKPANLAEPLFLLLDD